MKVLYFLLLLSVLLFSASCSPQPKSVAEQDALDEVKRTIRLGADPHSRELKNHLDEAIREKYISVVYCLLDAGVPIPIDAMENACSNLELLKLFHKRGAKGENEALYAAASHGYSDSVEYLVSIGATNLDEAMKKASSSLIYIEEIIIKYKHNKDLRRYGYYSAEEARLLFSKIVKFLLQKGARPTTDTIRWSIKADDIVLFKRLLARCYPPKLLKHKIFLRSMDFQPLQEALAEALDSNGKHRNEIIQILMGYPLVFYINSYFAALKRKEFAIAEILLQKYDRDKNKKYIESFDGLVINTLPVAVEHSQKKLIRILLQKGGGNLGLDRYSLRYESQHLLEKAIKNNDPEMLELLLIAGFSFNDFSSDEILLYTIKTNNVKILSVMLEAGISPAGGELVTAYERGNKEILHLLMHHHFDISKIRKNSYLKKELTDALLVAIYKNDIAAVKLFLQSGANIYVISGKKLLPIYKLASEKNKILREDLCRVYTFYKISISYLDALQMRDINSARQMFISENFDSKGKFQYYSRRKKELSDQRTRQKEYRRNCRFIKINLSNNAAQIYVEQKIFKYSPAVMWMLSFKKVANSWFISDIEDIDAAVENERN